MLARLRKSLEEKDEGFTLIELLVVIIIIGILAAIAIPVFLNQRKKGWDAAAKSDLRNAATAEETVLTDTGAYTNVVGVAGPPATGLVAAGFKATPGNTAFTIVTRGTGAPAAGVDSYCMVVTSQSSTKFYYDSAAGGLLSGTATCS